MANDTTRDTIREGLRGQGIETQGDEAQPENTDRDLRSLLDDRLSQLTAFDTSDIDQRIVDATPSTLENLSNILLQAGNVYLNQPIDLDSIGNTEELDRLLGLRSQLRAQNTEAIANTFNTLVAEEQNRRSNETLIRGQDIQKDIAVLSVEGRAELAAKEAELRRGLQADEHDFRERSQEIGINADIETQARQLAHESSRDTFIESSRLIFQEAGFKHATAERIARQRWEKIQRVEQNIFTEAQRISQNLFSSKQADINRTFTALQAKADRDHNSIEAKILREFQAEQSREGREHQSDENRLNREASFAELTARILSTESEGALNRQLQRDLQTEQLNAARDEKTLTEQQYNMLVSFNPETIGEDNSLFPFIRDIEDVLRDSPEQIKAYISTLEAANANGDLDRAVGLNVLNTFENDRSETLISFIDGSFERGDIIREILKPSRNNLGFLVVPRDTEITEEETKRIIDAYSDVFTESVVRIGVNALNESINTNGGR